MGSSANIPFNWLTGVGDGTINGDNASVPTPIPEINLPTNTGYTTSSQGVDLTPLFNMFGMTPSNTPATVGINNSSGLFGGLQQWVTQNPGAALLLGLLIFTMVGGALGPKGRGR